MRAHHILIVEDSMIVAFHLQISLQARGYIVDDTCTSGEQALLFIENQKPDLVLMDITLAGKMDGIEAAQIIATRFGIPVIFLTALRDQQTIERARIICPSGFLTKPFGDQEMFETIEGALARREAI